MSRRGKRRGRPVPDAVNLKQITYELEKALILEHKYKSNLFIANMDRKPGEVALTARDTAVQSIRFLKFWLLLSSEVFFTAVSLLDRFLTKMKVQERFLACVSISCLNTAAEIHKCNINTTHLLNLSQTKCSVKDMYRMCDIIRKKLDVESREQPVTVYSYLNLILHIFDCVAFQLNNKVAPKMLQRKILHRRLEVIMTNYRCASKRSPVIAFTLIQYELQKFISIEHGSKNEMLKLLRRINELQCVCMITPGEFNSCYVDIGHILKKYDDHCKMSNVQKLKWRFSTSTLFIPRPLDKFHTNLNRISEDF